ncbi:hypothetical protein ACHAXH_004567 [Discostella pseudostelligera]
MSLRSPLLLSALLIATATGFSTNINHGIVVSSRSSSSSSSSALSMVAVDTSEIKNGLTIELDGEPYKVLNFSIMKQARGAAKTTIKMKNLKRGNTIENTYRSGEKFETAEILRKPSQYTYEDDAGNYYFMDSESFEEVMVESKMIEEQKKWISEGMECDLIYFKGDVIEVRAPSPYIFTVVETEPNVKGNTSQGYTKPAVLNCGATISVPGFVEQGSKVKVDTEKGEYIERV